MCFVTDIAVIFISLLAMFIHANVRATKPESAPYK